MKKRQWIISILLSLLILLIGAFAFRSFSAKKESTISSDVKQSELRKVEVNTFVPSSVNKELEIDGRLSAYEKINISAEVQGRLLETGAVIKEGVHFKEGDLLFKIESKDDEYGLKAQRSQLFTAITQIMPDLKFDYPDAFEKWKKYLDDFSMDNTTRDLPRISSDKEKYFIGGKNIYNLYYNIKGQEERLKNYNVYAPFTGVFLSVNNYPGSLVSPGVGLAQIMNTYQYELISPVSGNDLNYLKVGQEIQLESEESGKTFRGKVNRISTQIDQATQSIPVYISVFGSGLRDGMYLKGKLSGSKMKEVSIVPKDIIVNQNQIYIYQDSTISVKTIDVLSIIDDKAQVRGITSTDQVVTSSVNNLYSGQKVKI